MNLIFQYEKQKDIWCLLNKGKSSGNSPKPTKQYEQLKTLYQDNPSNEVIGSFIDAYFLDKNIDIEKYVDAYQKDWDAIAESYTKKAEEIFGVSLPKNIQAYLTVNYRCPYSLEENYFFVTVPTYPYIARKTAMHEL